MRTFLRWPYLSTCIWSWVHWRSDAILKIHDEMGLSQWQRNEKALIRSCVCRQSGSSRWQGSGGAPHRATKEAAEQAFSIPLSSLLTDPPKFCFNLLGQTPTRGALFLCLFKTATVIQRRLRSCDPKCFHLPDFSGSVWTARLKWKLERQVNENSLRKISPVLYLPWPSKTQQNWKRRLGQ